MGPTIARRSEFAQRSRRLALALATVLWPVVSSAVCNDAMPPEAPDSRYVDLNDGTVSDTATGLRWKQCPEGLTGAGCLGGTLQRLSWGGALKRAVAINDNGGFAGFSDWRLPNINELVSLIEHRCARPAINPTLFPATTGTTSRPEYWSSSPQVNNDGYVWFVDFTTGELGAELNDEDVTFNVRLVRGGVP